MRHSFRGLLGLAAATAVLAIGLPAVTSAANASEARRSDVTSEARRSDVASEARRSDVTSEARRSDVTSEARRSGEDPSAGGSWGTYYSKYYEGARAHARAKWYADDNGRIFIGGKLYDKGSPDRLCGYVQVKYEDFQPEDRGTVYHSAKQCGGGYKPFRFWEVGAFSAYLRVCYMDAYKGRQLCGSWVQVYQGVNE